MKKLIYTFFTIALLAIGIGVLYVFFIKPNTTPTTHKSMKKATSVTTKKKVTTNKETTSAIDTDILLVNKAHPLGGNYIPQNLVVPKVKFISTGDPNVREMNSTAATALENMFAGAKQDGFTLLAVSGYRSYKYQTQVYNAKVIKDGKASASEYVAIPGESEHQTGLAMDLLSTEYTELDDGFAKTKSYEWLEANCAKYGFIIRYLKGKENITKYNFEPWHMRYVGVNAAETIMEKGITLEEYLGKTG